MAETTLKDFDELTAQQRRAVKVLSTCLGTAHLEAVGQVQQFNEEELAELDEIHTALQAKPIADRVRDVINAHVDRVEREKAAAPPPAADAVTDEQPSEQL